jgi:threonine synthase
MTQSSFQQKYHYQCINCDATYEGQYTIYLCPACAAKNSQELPPMGVLKTMYDYKSLRKHFTGFATLRSRGFIDLLPIEKLSSLPKLRVGETPLYSINKLNDRKLPFEILLKDDSQNPTFSFKDRASALVSAYAKEHNFNTIVAASTGNAGSSLAGICASQGQKAIIVVPASAPTAKLTQILMCGARLVPVNGTYDDAFDLSIKATELFGWYNRNTAYNPLTIEGKKTVAFELFEQLHFTVPDRIFVPVGDGVILSGVYKGFEDLLELKLIEKMPTMVAVQSTGSDNLIRNLGSETFTIKASNTLADSISVDVPRNFYLTQHYLKKYNGEHLAVSDDEILSASSILAKNTGIFAEPAAATAFAGLLACQRECKLPDNSRNVVLLTGSGLKDLKSVQKLLNLPASIDPTIENLKKIMS